MENRGQGGLRSLATLDALLGPGGKVIHSIVERTGVKIDVEDDGRINIASSDDGAAQRAIAIIQELTATPEQDKVYMGRVERITDFGASIEVMPGVDGLLHVSALLSQSQGVANHRHRAQAHRPRRDDRTEQ